MKCELPHKGPRDSGDDTISHRVQPKENSSAHISLVCPEMKRYDVSRKVLRRSGPLRTPTNYCTRTYMSGIPDECVVLIEAESPGPRLSWCFPSIGDAADAVSVLAARAQLLGGPLTKPTFVWFRWKSKFYYALAKERHKNDLLLSDDVKRYAVLVGSPVFDPERYQAMLQVLMRAYCAEWSPIALLQRVLTLATKGVASAPGGADFHRKSYSAETAKTACPLGAMIKRIGAEGIATLWAAILLRARVAVVAEEPMAQLDVLRCLPLLATQRSAWESLRPLCALEPPQLEELQRAGGYVAGFVTFVPVKKGSASMEGGEKALADALAAKTVEILAHKGNAPAEWKDFLDRLQKAESIGAAA